MVYSRKRKLNFKNKLRTIKKHQRGGAAAPRKSRSGSGSSRRSGSRSGSPRSSGSVSPREDNNGVDGLVTYLREAKRFENKKGGILNKFSVVCKRLTPRMFRSKGARWQEDCRKDLIKIARNSLTKKAKERANASIRKAAPVRFIKEIMAPGTGRVEDEEGVLVAKEWYASIGALMADAKAPTEGKKVSHVTKNGKRTQLKVGDVFMPFKLLEDILSIKIKDKTPETQGLLFKPSDYEAKIGALEILINEVKKKHHRKGTGYRLVDYGKVGTKTPLYSKFRFPQTEFTYKQLNSLLGHKVFPESPGDGDGGVGASTRQVAAALKEVSLFPSTEGLVPIFPSTKHLVQSIKPTKTKAKPIPIAVPRG